jgi:protein-tyrosine-phosphatase
MMNVLLPLLKKTTFLFHIKEENITVQDFDPTDYIYVMDSSNYDDVMQLAAPEHQEEVKMILNYSQVKM